MLQGLIGRKVGMTQLFSDDGDVIPVTAIEAGPCWIVQKKTTARDGYTAVQLGFGAKKAKRVTKPLRGHFQRSGVAPTQWLREFHVDAQTLEECQEGQEVSGEIFMDCRYVDVIGSSKGASADPARVWKNKGMAGQYGHARVTVRNLEVVHFLKERNLLLVKGAVPGPNGGMLLIQVSSKQPH